MPYFDEIAGHAVIKTVLEKAIESPQNGYLLFGSEGLGNHLLAEAFIRALAEYPKERPLSAHPDIILLEREMNDAGTALKKEISVKAIRELRMRIAGRPSIAKRMVIYIPEADRLNEEGVNALLKSVEEPPAGAVFVFVTHALAKIPETLLSRLIQLELKPLSSHQMQEWLTSINSKEPERLLQIANGRPGHALRFLQEESFMQDVFEAERFVDRILTSTSIGGGFAVIGEWANRIEKKEDPVTEWRKAIQLWQGALSRKIIEQPTRAEIIAKALIRAEQAIGSSISPRIILESQLATHFYTN